MEELLAIALLPVILLCYFIYQKDINKEPSRLLKKLFGFGCLIVVPIMVVELFLDNFFPTTGVLDFLTLLINVFVSVAIVEEGFKWLVVKMIGFDNNEFDEIYDSIVYSVFVSLGFACVENILYVFLHGYGTGVARALTAVPGHTSFGVIMGYFLAKAKVNQMNYNQGLYSQNLIFSLIVPSILHTLYDAIIMYAVAAKSFSFVVLFLAFIVALFICCFIIVQKISKVQSNVNHNVSTGNIIYDQGSVSMNTSQINLEVINQAAEANISQQELQSVSPNFCPICGKPAHGKNFCSFCGYRLKL